LLKFLVLVVALVVVADHIPEVPTVVLALQPHSVHWLLLQAVMVLQVAILSMHTLATTRTTVVKYGMVL
jgi:hypothetical protein